MFDDMSKVQTVVTGLLLVFGIFLVSGNKHELITVETDSEDDVTITESEEQHFEKFEPTKQWQTIKPGQAIPAGLHIRINLQTGKKEAKILEESKPKELSESDLEETIGNVQPEKLDPKVLRKALKSLKSDEPKSIKDADQVKKNFRNIEDLKKEFSDLNLNIKTDTEILIDQIEKYKRQENKVIVLQDLEFLVHQYDVAQNFVKLGGIDLLLPDVNSTDDKVRSLVAFTLGSAMQGNPKVQIAVLESSAMQNLLRLVMLDPSEEVQVRALYALSCLLRQFPVAQKKFVESGGITALADIFRHQLAPSLKLQVKVVTLLHDLLSEQHLTEKYAQDRDKVQQEKLRQYKSFQLEAALQNNGFCTFLPKLLAAPDFDIQEKVVNAMQSLVHICKEAFSPSLSKLYYLEKFYEAAAVEEAAEYVSQGNVNLEEFYFASVYKAVHNLIESVNQNISRDEL